MKRASGGHRPRTTATCMDNFCRVWVKLRPTPSGRWGLSCSSSIMRRLLVRETDNKCVALHDSKAITRTVIGASSPYSKAESAYYEQLKNPNPSQYRCRRW